MLQSVKRRTNHVVGIGRSLALGHDVVHAERLENGPHRTTRDDPGSRRRGAKDDLSSAVPTKHVMVKCPSFTKRHTNETALGGLSGLSNGLRHFSRLAVAKSDPALLVPYYHQCCETEPASALYDLGDPVDMNQPIHKFTVTLLAVALTFTCHLFSSFVTCAGDHLTLATDPARFEA